jgi:hypothetical protein
MAAVVHRGVAIMTTTLGIPVVRQAVETSPQGTLTA